MPAAVVRPLGEQIARVSWFHELIDRSEDRPAEDEQPVGEAPKVLSESTNPRLKVTLTKRQRVRRRAAAAKAERNSKKPLRKEAWRDLFDTVLAQMVELPQFSRASSPTVGATNVDAAASRESPQRSGVEYHSHRDDSDKPTRASSPTVGATNVEAAARRESLQRPGVEYHSHRDDSGKPTRASSPTVGATNVDAAAADSRNSSSNSNNSRSSNTG